MSAIELNFREVRNGNRVPGSAPVLRVEQLSVRVGMRLVIEKLSFELFPGDAIAVFGPNGSGKSTLLNAIAGVMPAQIVAGRIFFLGTDVTHSPAHERARLGLSFMRQRHNVFPELSVDENLRLALGSDGPARFREAYAAWSSSLAGGKRVGLLSGGEKQRLAWAMVALRRSELLLADEPEAGLNGTFALPNSSLLYVSHAEAFHAGGV